MISQGALKVDPEKLEAIVNMPSPTDKPGLTRLLEMITYLDKFCKDLTVITRPLRDILKQNAAWVWDKQQEKALCALKTAISSLPVLKLFDLSKPLVVLVDASPMGIGAVLLQDGQPVTFSSTSLTETQKRYCQIEKELWQYNLAFFVLGSMCMARRYLLSRTINPWLAYWTNQLLPARP